MDIPQPKPASVDKSSDIESAPNYNGNAEDERDLPDTNQVGKKATTKYERKKLEKMRKNYHLSRSRQPDYQEPESNPTLFRTIEQYYKRRLWEPDYNLGFGHHSIPPSTHLSTVLSPVEIEWSTPNHAQSIQAQIRTLPATSSQSIKPCEFCHPRTSQRICTFPKQYPGLIYLPSYLCPHQQADLVDDCLTNGLRKPNVTNIDTHWQTPYEPGIYELYRTWSDHNQKQPEDTDSETAAQFILNPRITPSSSNPEPAEKPSSSQETANKSRRQKVDFEPINSENFLVARNDRPKEDPTSSKTVEPIHIRDVWMNGKLRWCTIGWQYHWPTKTYHFEREPTPISNLVQSTCKNLVNHVIPWDMIEGEFEQEGDTYTQKDSSTDDWKTDYKPEAGVINFYQYRDALTAHIDHSEVSTDAPLVSLSVGQACMFLISPSREEEPLAIKLESGDGLIMSGPSRRYFHGVPRIIEHSLPAWLQQSPELLPPWAQWFQKGGRINLNVRQVF
ncbi:hypothetical protein PTTG_06089 [Puccinia triticina 1-1 BBBD Race 1]|uniref:Fe2OG dioxygenase domain-containing protein n=2 Tax=Puccinia triticina TaxID=208348 RepID=A0A180GDP0_PUCT1|nr:uncharacterized protein PtA15_18A352 [Puccinia triticina]OAV90800.1 hypothetical protein PTTG_06089 [Puccinia triticina 1-1 BBBD Race 1]WAQ93292.1 hypothetical protein PtA15_18A352 [Puccinia triticina]WAR63283.1 hypothetical protein PtB15_18B366 [Puccinia triticina]